MLGLLTSKFCLSEKVLAHDTEHYSVADSDVAELFCTVRSRDDL